MISGFRESAIVGFLRFQNRASPSLPRKWPVHFLGSEGAKPLREGVRAVTGVGAVRVVRRSEEHTSELQSLMRISYAVFCLKKKKRTTTPIQLRSANITTTHTTQ